MALAVMPVTAVICYGISKFDIIHCTLLVDQIVSTSGSRHKMDGVVVLMVSIGNYGLLVVKKVSDRAWKSYQPFAS